MADLPTQVAAEPYFNTLYQSSCFEDRSIPTFQTRSAKKLAAGVVGMSSASTGRSCLIWSWPSTIRASMLGRLRTKAIRMFEG
ncbi:hypothetical protein HMPREF0972_01618 [Actinomyces sp. oral taxon 848 str. F0332]|nr:hypothetical protein HMPREF0972_01618 [Actinomyces sp. oral taxon 848 str. F0332]